MKESTAAPLNIDAIASRIRQTMIDAKGNTLLDMQESLPHLRAFLLGGAQSDGQAPSGTLMIGHALGGLALTMRIPLIGVEVQYAFETWYGTLETLELDLAEGTTRWQPDYKQRRKENAKWVGVVE